MDQVELGLRIRRARERIGMSQESFSEAVKRDQKAVSEYENGKRKLPATELPTFARVLGVPVSYFFEGDFQVDDLDQLLLQEFHTLPTQEDKQAAIQAVQLISDTIKRHSSE
ncbi:MAG: helix-turn-helix transcriptional regulator [Anaerolineales bacterium]|nr:helix-turn-helix transcriptional regulator [Anaerolineales bacterium]